MKKLYVIGVLLVSVFLLPAEVFATVSVTWATDQGAIVAPGGQDFGDALPIGSIAQLIWTTQQVFPETAHPDNWIDNPATALAAQRPTDVVLVTAALGGVIDPIIGELPGMMNRTDTLNPASYDMPPGQSTFVGGYVFWRVFNSPLVGGVVFGEPADTSVPVNTWYTEGTPTQADFIMSGPLAAQPTIEGVDMVFHATLTDDEVASGFKILPLDRMVIPEPGAVGFLLIGVGVLVARRALRKRHLGTAA